MNEHPYRVERILLQLHQAGVLDAQKAVLLGAFSDWRKSPLDRGYTLTTAVAHCAPRRKTPILTGLPFGHVPTKVTLPVGARVSCWWRGATRSSAGSMPRLDEPAPPSPHRPGPCLARGRSSSRRLQQQPVARRRGGDEHAVLRVRRALAAPPGPDGLVRRTRNALHLPDLRAALRLPLPEAAVRAGARRRRAQVAKPLLPRQGRASRCPTTRPGADRRERLRRSRSSSGIMFQPHPAFAKDAKGNYLYHAHEAGRAGRPALAAGLRAPGHARAGRRRLRLRAQAPCDDAHQGADLRHLLRVRDRPEGIRRADQGRGQEAARGLDPATRDKPFLDFRSWPLAGASAPDKHLLRIRIKGKYPQWNYWMAMTFMAPVPWEADAFYAQPGMAEQRPDAGTWPVGTGPFMMTEYVKDRRHVMKRNPNYRGEPYPCEGMPGDKEAGLLDDCGKPMPFIDTLVVDDREGDGAAQGQVPPGLSTTSRSSAPTTGVDFRRRCQRLRRGRARIRGEGLQLPADAPTSPTGTSASTCSTR